METVKDVEQICEEKSVSEQSALSSSPPPPPPSSFRLLPLCRNFLLIYLAAY
jgi:hypothetical protein